MKRLLSISAVLLLVTVNVYAMYSVNVDKTKKLIKVNATGFIKLSEANSILSEMQAAFKQFKPKESLVLINMTSYKPVSADVATQMAKITTQAQSSALKVAIVSPESPATKKKVSEEQSGNLRRFSTEEEALKYLFP